MRGGLLSDNATDVKSVGEVPNEEGADIAAALNHAVGGVEEMLRDTLSGVLSSPDR